METLLSATSSAGRAAGLAVLLAVIVFVRRVSSEWLRGVTIPVLLAVLLGLLWKLRRGAPVEASLFSKPSRGDGGPSSAQKEAAAEHSTGLRRRRYKLAGDRRIYPGRSVARLGRIRQHNLSTGNRSRVADGRDPTPAPPVAQAPPPEPPERAPKPATRGVAARDPSQLELVFHMLDKDDDGAVSLRDVQGMLTKGDPAAALTTNLMEQLALLKGLGSGLVVDKATFVSALGGHGQFWEWLDAAPPAALS